MVGVTCWDGEGETATVDPVYVTPGQCSQILLDRGGGSLGYGSYYVATSKGAVGHQWGVNDYPNRWAAIGSTLQEGESLDVTVTFYREHPTSMPSPLPTPLKTIPFQIIARSPSTIVTDGDVTLGDAELVYNGAEQKPAVTVAKGGTPLVEGRDYTVSYADHINAGEATVTVTGIGGCVGQVTKTFTIGRKPLTVEGASLTGEDAGITPCPPPLLSPL